MTILNVPTWRKAADTYDAAADHFDDAPLAFWDRHGRRAVEGMGLCAGDRVLDVGCGTGASALPAALAVGPHGHVTGVDVAANMLARARKRARAGGFENVTFVQADMGATGFADASFDATISVFSIFFVADMAAQVAELWRLLRPGGALAVTVWGPHAFAPGAAIFDEELRCLRPDLASTAPAPWQLLTTTDRLRALLRDGGVSAAEMWPAPDDQPLAYPAAFWTIAMGSGFRWQIEQLTSAERSQLRERVVGRLSARGVRAIDTSAIHAIARK